MQNYKPFSMVHNLQLESNHSLTQNGGAAYRSSLCDCVDLFFSAGAMRACSEKQIADAVIRAYTQDADKTMKIVFYARDARGGLGERRFFRAAIRALAGFAPLSVKKNIRFFAKYGRYDDLCALLGTCLEGDAADIINRQLEIDRKAMKSGEKASLLAKWLPSANASSAQTRAQAQHLAQLLGLSKADYRKTLSALRRYIDILENRLRERDYSFDYSVQPSCAMLRYRRAFIRNDGERYRDFLNSTLRGEVKLNAGRLYPYEIVRSAAEYGLSEDERLSLEAAWNALPDLCGSKHINALAVIDGSGSMNSSVGGVRPIEAALSLGMYFAQHNKGAFADHFITFSQTPRLVKIRGRDIVEKTLYCAQYNEIANTDLEAVFTLILETALRHGVPKEEMPERLYIISDMQFDRCVVGGNDIPLFEQMQQCYRQNGYELPQVVFWDVACYDETLPVLYSQTGAALVSGFSPSIFDMVMGDDISPEKVMNDVICSERYKDVTAA